MSSEAITKNDLKAIFEGIGLSSNFSSETLGTNAYLYRLGRLRLLVFNGATGTYADIPSGDRPSVVLRGVGMRRNSSAMNVTMAMIKVEVTGEIVLYKATSYNNSSTGLTSWTSTDEITGQLMWIV